MELHIFACILGSVVLLVIASSERRMNRLAYLGSVTFSRTSVYQGKALMLLR